MLGNEAPLWVIIKVAGNICFIQQKKEHIYDHCAVF